MNIFDKKVSVFLSVKDKMPTAERTLLQVLNNHKIKDKVFVVRNCENTEEKNILKSNLPGFLPSGITPDGRSDDNLIHNGVISIDIDYKDNMHIYNFDDMTSIISKSKFVAYCGKSCGGKGFFILIPISNTNKHREHFKALQKDFEEIGITIDRSGINPSRFRYFSYDDEGYFNFDAEIYEKVFEEKKKVHAPILYNEDSDFHKILNKINQTGIDITGGYDDWFTIGCAVANHCGESGRQYYHDISRHSDKYKTKDTDIQYDRCLKCNRITIKSFFQISSQYGILAKY